MKKIVSIAILFAISSIAYSQTCPPADQIIVNRNGQNVVVPPPGWILRADDRHGDNNLRFSVAAWGDHVHSTDYVRCHYYGPQGKAYPHVQLETMHPIAESNIPWESSTKHYQLCVSRSNNVNDCPFN